MKFKLIAVAVLVVLLAGLAGYGWWRLDLRWRPREITHNQAEITTVLEQSGWVSPGLEGAKLYMIGFHGCAGCDAFKAQVWPQLHAAGVDTRLIQVARADEDGAPQSTPLERATVAELWVNRSWALSERWDQTPAGAWRAEGITPADTDVARTAVVEAGRRMVADLTPLLRANGIRFDYPLLIWQGADGVMRGCACQDERTYRFVVRDLTGGS